MTDLPPEVLTHDATADLLHALECACIKLSRYRQQHPETWVGGVQAEYDAVLTLARAAIAKAGAPAPRPQKVDGTAALIEAAEAELIDAAYAYRAAKVCYVGKVFSTAHPSVLASKSQHAKDILLRAAERLPPRDGEG